MERGLKITIHTWGNEKEGINRFLGEIDDLVESYHGSIGIDMEDEEVDIPQEIIKRAEEEN